MKEKIFNKEQFKLSEEIINNKNLRFSLLSKRDLEELSIIWSYYSGKIEGNSYSLIETQSLLKNGMTAYNKSLSDGKMLENLNNVFSYFIREIKENKKIKIDESTILSIHSSLTTGLLDISEMGKYRKDPVRITGTEYRPPIDNLNYYLNKILVNQELYTNPIEKSIYLHCNIAKLQPFADGNKRTSRVIESIVLMSNDIVPVHSYKDYKDDFIEYQTSLVHFYETNDYSKYSDFSLKLINEKIKEFEKSTVIYKEKNKEIKQNLDCDDISL